MRRALILGLAACTVHAPLPTLLPARLSSIMIDAALDTVRGAIDRCGADAGQPAGTRVQLRLRVDGPTGQVVSAWASARRPTCPWPTAPCRP